MLALNCKTHYSLLKAFSKSKNLAQRCKEYGYTSCVIADIKTISGAMDFHKSCIDHGIKPIIGCDFGEYLIIAKNKDGWFELIRCVSDQSLSTVKRLAKNKNLLCVSKKKNGMSSIFGENFFQYDYMKDGVFYVDKEDAECHRILLCSGMKSTIPKINKKLRTEEDFDNKDFFVSSNFFLKKPKQNKTLDKIESACEEYGLSKNPILPNFTCPEGFNQDDYLRELCRQGWKKRSMSVKANTPELKNIYGDRVKKELGVILRAELSGYFLIVQDIVNEIKSRGWLAGPGRGSAAGCLISYLIGITEVDPIEHDLIFERFYNEGRNTDGNTSLPDIDVDVPAEHRDEIIDYIKQKYGKENVSQMVTFGRLQGRAALKEVLRINDCVSFAEMNEITKYIPNEAEISDQLEMMEEKSIIGWALENDPDSVKSWCFINEEGDLEGPLVDVFKTAIKIEGTNKSQGKHAAGVIISKNELKDVCPMVEDKNGQMIAAFEMNDLESQGHVKFDILGIDLLSKIMEIVRDEK